MTHDATAQTWPSRPVRIVVPFAPGSFTESAARAVGQVLSDSLGQPFVVDTRGGAGSTLGTDLVAHAAPDGYTLLMTDNSFAVSAALYANLPYDPSRDVLKVSSVAESPAVIVVRHEASWRTLTDLVDEARRRPATLSYGSGGQGSSAHLALAPVASEAQLDLIHVPYKGVAAALLDLVAGRVDLGLSSAGSAAQYIRNGQLRGLAVTGRERHPLIAAVPTFAEAGYPQYDMSYWFGLMAPAGLPRPVLDRLHAALARAVEQPKVVEIFAATGARAVASTPAEFAERIDREIRTWKTVINKAGIRVE
jgi:tripartite-type tricarboxylate transporter receptor subunit TctC